MIGTVIAILIAVFFVITSIGNALIINTSVGYALILVAGLFILILGVIRALAWTPLQRAEESTTPRILDLYKRDRYLRYGHFWLVLFPLSTFVISILILNDTSGNAIYFFSLWIVLLGISLDMLNIVLRRIISYFSPFMVLTMFTKEAKLSIQDDKEVELCNWIDAISDVGLKAIERKSTTLCNQAIDEIQLLTRNFLESEKSISHPLEDQETKDLGIKDKVSYTLFFIFHRLEHINENAIHKRLEPICSNLINAMGKIAIYGAKFDLSIPTYPLHYLGKFAKKAQETMPDIGLKASCALLEVAKTIVNEVDLSYGNLKEPFFSIIAHLDDIAKMTFQKDKTTNIKILTQPFYDLKELFKNPRVANHQDTPAIIQNLDRVIGEFDALEMVLRTIPPIPSFAPEPSPDLQDIEPPQKIEPSQGPPQEPKDTQEKKDTLDTFDGKDTLETFDGKDTLESQGNPENQ